MIHRIQGAGGPPGPASLDRSLQLLKQRIHLNSMVHFRYRGTRQTGRVMQLFPRAVVVEFRFQGAERLQRVGYGSILRVLEP